MKDINKIKIIHEIKNAFSVDDATLSKFIEQIDSSDFKNNIERFFRGYKVEDNFHTLFAAMPWVKLVHELGQNQLPVVSKEIYQVPDFTIYFETSKKENKAILLEVKSVKGDSQSLELMSKQLNACIAYSKVVNIPFVYAIYWAKYQTWTLNAVENFEMKRAKHKIKIFDALKNDLSVIIGDITFILNQPIYRKTICNISITDGNNTRHEKFGAIISDSVSIDNINFIDMKIFESAIIDVSFKMKLVNAENHGDITILTEESEGNHFLKLSTLTLRHLGIFGVELNEQYTNVSRIAIIEFFKKLNITRSFAVPNIKTPTSDVFYKQAFSDSWLFKNYKAL